MNHSSTAPATFMPSANQSQRLFDSSDDGSSPSSKTEASEHRSSPFQSPIVNGSSPISVSRPKLGFCPSSRAQSEDNNEKEEYSIPTSTFNDDKNSDDDETEDVGKKRRHVCLEAEPINKRSSCGPNSHHHQQRRFGPRQPISCHAAGLGQSDYHREPDCNDRWRLTNRDIDEEHGEDSLPQPPGFSHYYVQETRPTGVGAGLNNLGNTCFLNSVLQCFTHTVPLVKALRSCKHVAQSCGSEEFCALCALWDHVEVSLASSGGSFAPRRIVDNLNKISSTFQTNEQEDAHEFFMALLDKIEGCLGLEAIDKSLSLQDVNIVKQVFGGRFISKLRCCVCGHQSTTYESMLSLSLGIEEADTLESALESFSSWEKVEYPGPKRCEGCKEETSWEKQLMVDEAPCIATMHLMRFDMNGSKILKHVGFPLELNLEPYTNGTQESNVELKYQLYAIVEHSGIFSSCGHYSCYIRSSRNTWHKMDDSQVTELEEEIVLSRSAYILFYAREGTPWFSTLMEPQKLSLDPSIISNTSPKSVLDNLDNEGNACTWTAKSDDYEASSIGEASRGNLSHISCGRMLEGFHMKESETNVEGITAQVCHGLRQSEQSSFCDVYMGDTPMIDVSVVPGTSDCDDRILYNEKPCVAPSAIESNGTQFAVSSGNGLHSGMPSKSRSPDTFLGKLPESKCQILQDHLKAESQVSCRKPSKKAIRDRDSERTEAVRFMKTMPTGRRMQLMAAMSPRNDKRKANSSPCKKASPRRKLLEPVAAWR